MVKARISNEENDNDDDIDGGGDEIKRQRTEK